jgi:hypothetical protein
MYSKKINQLATNLNPQSDDLIPIGDAITGQLKTTSYSNISGGTSDGVISGGIVTWTGTGLIFNISACTYILNGVRYSSPFTTKTLDASDPTYDRIDVFAVNTSGQVEVIKGTPALNPVEPEGDTPTTLGLTNVTIAGGATTPNNVTRDLIYDENVESWTKTASVTPGTYNFADTAYANTGTKSILITQGAGFTLLKFSKASAMDISNYKSISFAIRLNSAWTSNQILAVTFYNGTNQVSNTYQLTATNKVGFNRNLATTWQTITIPLDGTLLKFKSNQFTEFRILTTNAAATYRLDTIQLNNGINNPGGTTSTNSFGFVNGSTGTAIATQATDTLNVLGTGLATTSASGKTLTIAVPTPIPTQTGNSGKFLTTNGSIVSWATPTDTGITSLNGLTGTTQTFATGTTGTDFGITSTGTSHTFNIPTSSSSNRGLLSSSDWTLFNGKESALTFSSPLSRSTNTISIPAATNSVNGYLSSTDWSTFNGKQDTITLTTTGTSGAATLVGNTLNIPQYSGTNIYNADGTLTSARTLTSGGYLLTFTGSNTASSAIARGILMNHTLVASANSDVLVGLDINPTFTNGAFTGVSNIGLRVIGADIVINTLNIGLGSGSVASNTVVGLQALNSNTTGTNNTSIGYQSLKNNLTGNSNTALGYKAGLSTTVNQGTFVGDQSGLNVSSGPGNVLIGYIAGQNITTGSQNTIIGTSTRLGTTSTNNSILGSGCGTGVTGNNNVFIGFDSGRYYSASNTAATAYTNSIMIGYRTKQLADGQTNQIVIGYDETGLGSNTTIIGNASTVTSAIRGRLLLGTTTDSGLYQLDVNGTSRFQNNITASTKIFAGTTDTTSTRVITAYTTTAASQIYAVGTTPSIGFTNAITGGAFLSAVGCATATNDYVTGTVSGDMIVVNQTSAKRLYVVATSGGVYLTSAATSWTANSDITLKNINSYITDAVNKLMNLSVINYHLKDDTTKKEQIGLIAQEVKEVFPEIIEISESGILGLRYTELIPVLVKAIQELKTEINILKNK